MHHSFAATLLLAEPWALDCAAIAATLRTRFPQIGEIDVAALDDGAHNKGAVTIDSAMVTLEVSPTPLPASSLSPALSTLKTWDSDAVVRGHAAHMTVSCKGPLLGGVDGAKAYAAVCHFVAAAAALVAPVQAVFWGTGWALTEASAFIKTTSEILNGRMPITSWVSFATIVPKGYQADTASGMVTYGMRAFVGRELELAPRMDKPANAFRIVNGVSRKLLNSGDTLTDDLVLRMKTGPVTVSVAARDYWLRRNVPAYVLVTEDSLIEPGTLRPREAMQA